MMSHTHYSINTFLLCLDDTTEGGRHKTKRALKSCRYTFSVHLMHKTNLSSSATQYGVTEEHEHSEQQEEKSDLKTDIFVLQQ